MKPEMYELLHKIIKDRAERSATWEARFYYTNMLDMLEYAKADRYDMLVQFALPEDEAI